MSALFQTTIIYSLLCTVSHLYCNKIYNVRLVLKNIKEIT